MKLFLTSSIGGGYIENGVNIPCRFEDANCFLDILKKQWLSDSKCLILSSDPDNELMNDKLKSDFAESFRISDLPVTEMEICDKRNESKIVEMIQHYNVLILAGGHIPTQNRFFHNIKLKELLKNYAGIIIAISAGTMNCADVVYAQPEEEGEVVDSQYQRYLNGLNLTKINILPHFQEIKNRTVDGLRALEDISLPDSKIRPFYALVDGSYIYIEDNNVTLYGEAYWIESGSVMKICKANQAITIVDGGFLL